MLKPLIVIRPPPPPPPTHTHTHTTHTTHTHTQSYQSFYLANKTYHVFYENSFIRYSLIALKDERTRNAKNHVIILSPSLAELKNPVIVLVTWYWTIISDFFWYARDLFLWWTFKQLDVIQIYMIHQLITLFSSVAKMLTSLTSSA